MDVRTHDRIGEEERARTLAGPVAIGALAVSVGLAALGVFGEAADADTTGFLVVCVIAAVASVLVFGFVVPSGLRKEAAPGTALALSILGLAAVAVFWSGLPPILAAGGTLLGASGWTSPRGRTLCRVAVLVGALALGAHVAVAVGDWLANR